MVSMKFHYKRWILIANDITNILLHRERTKADERAETLTWWLIAMTVLLLISVGVNVYLVLQVTGV